MARLCHHQPDWRIKDRRDWYESRPEAPRWLLGHGPTGGVGPDWQARSSIPGSGLSSVPKVVERVLLSWIGARKPTSSRAGDAETKKLVRAEGVEPSWTF